MPELSYHSGITQVPSKAGGTMLFHAGRQAEIRPLKSSKGYRFRAPGHAWTSGNWSQKGALRRARRALMKAGGEHGLTEIPYREIEYYDNLETGGVQGRGIEALDRCPDSRHHVLNMRAGAGRWICTRCGRITTSQPNLQRTGEPIYSDAEVVAYDHKWRGAAAS